MKFYPQDIVEKVRNERKKGLSLRVLEKKFSIPNNTISAWVRDIYIDNQWTNNVKKRVELHKKEYENIFKVKTLSKDRAKIFASLLYWCEGGKYPTSNRVSFTNSDTSLVKAFIKLLRFGFEIDDSKFRVVLQIHTTHDYNKLVDYWCDLLDLKPSQFSKPTITVARHLMKRKNYLGTCTLKYYDVKLLLNMIGIYEHVAITI